MDAIDTSDGSVRLCLSGDVMCGRGIDQILGHPGDPATHESYVRSAVGYVELAEVRSGPIPREVAPSYVWGDALDSLERLAADVFVVNLETAVTARGRPWPGKGIHYRMHPANIDCLRAAGIDVAVLANNHVLDWSYDGLDDTVTAVRAASIATTGAGPDAEAAWAPAVVDLGADRGRVLVFGMGAGSSGIPPGWAATDERPGVALLPDLSEDTISGVAAMVQARARSDDLVVASLHWGGNWGYGVDGDRLRFARGLVERAGVHVVHGHSSHHAIGIEVHAGGLILYGCGDLLTDYEGIHGHEEYRGGLGALYVPTLDGTSGRLRSLQIVPCKVERFRLVRPDPAEVRWLAGVLDREGAEFGTGVQERGDGTLALTW